MERSFAHVCDTGGARRSWLHGIEKVQKRYLIAAVARNLGLVMRKLFGIGTPRGLQAEGGLFVFVQFVCFHIYEPIASSASRSEVVSCSIWNSARPPRDGRPRQTNLGLFQRAANQ